MSNAACECNISARSSFIRGLYAGVPIGLGYLSVSFAFGITAISRGIPRLIVMLISMTNLTSAGQLAGVELMALGCGIGELLLSQCVINLRYALMGLSLAQKTDQSVRLRDRFLIAFGITDEVFALSASQPGLIGRYYLFGLIVAPYLGWSMGTLLGTVAGELLPQSVLSALGIAIYGMFVAIVIPPAKKSRAIVAVLAIAIGLSCAFRYLPYLKEVSSGFVVIVCALTAAVIGALAVPIADGGDVPLSADEEVRK